jgi:hypothetical protein
MFSAGILLILSFVALFAGASMYWRRGGLRGGAPPTKAYYVWERTFIIAAVVLTAVGLALLEGEMRSSDGRVLARVGAVTYFFGGVLVVVAEAASVGQFLEGGQSQQLWRLAFAYVVLAFLAQAAVGGALLQAGVVAGWIGWATVVWNVGLLLVMLIRRGDIYIPFLHHLMPLLIGIALVTA